jgi:hypothetical protein
LLAARMSWVSRLYAFVLVLCYYYSQICFLILLYISVSPTPHHKAHNMKDKHYSAWACERTHNILRYCIKAKRCKKINKEVGL